MSDLESNFDAPHGILRASSQPASASEDQGDDEQDDENDEQDLRDAGRKAGDAEETEETEESGDECDDQKDDGVTAWCSPDAASLKNLRPSDSFACPEQDPPISKSMRRDAGRHGGGE